MNADTALPRQAALAPEDLDRPRRWPGWLLALVTFLVGLAATGMAWYASRAAEEASQRVQLEFAANNIVNEVVDRFDDHVHTLWGAVGLFAANGEVTQEQWRAYVGALKPAERLPSTIAVGFAKRVGADERDGHIRFMHAQGFGEYRIWPEGERGEYVLVTFLEPLDERTRGALGFDFMSDQDRSDAVHRARDTGMPIVSSKVTLVRDQPADTQPGFLLFVPVYRNGAPVETVEDRRAALFGYVYSPFRAREFIISKILTQQATHSAIAFEIYDGAGIREENLLYRSPNFASSVDPAGGPVNVRTIAEIVGSRTWTFRVASLRPGLASAEQHIPLIVLAAGLLISLLASTVVGTLAMNRAQALAANQRLREDVVRRGEVEQQLRHSEAKFRRMFDSNPLPTFAIDRKTFRYIEVNEAAVKKYGYSHEEFGRLNITDLRPEEDVPEFRRFMDRVRDHESYAGEFRHKLRDGSVIDVECMAHNIEVDGRQATIVVAHDITERKQAQAALAEREQQLQQSQKLEAIGQLTGGIAHDFNNILTVITGTIEILADGVAHDAKLSAITKLIDEAATRGADLTRDLLAFARRQPLMPRDVDINTLVLNAAKLFRSTLGGHIEINTRLEAQLWAAFVDPGQLTTALLNLALNARDAMPGGGKLTLETANAVLDETYAQMGGEVEPGAYVMVAVSDTGIGIPPEIRSKVFEPFFTTKDVGKGTGLGLSMVYGFLKQSGGHIQIYSEQGYGTTIKLYLPRASDGPLAATDAATPHIVGGNETIFVVEDDALVRDFVTAQLASLGYTTHVASNGAEALAMVEEGLAFDLLFTDIVMPGGMNGRALAAEVRKRRPGVRVLFTSGYTEEAATRQGRLEEGVSLLNKPYRKVDLAQKVRDVLDAPAPDA